MLFRSGVLSVVRIPVRDIPNLGRYTRRRKCSINAECTIQHGHAEPWIPFIVHVVLIDDCDAATAVVVGRKDSEDASDMGHLWENDGFMTVSGRAAESHTAF